MIIKRHPFEKHPFVSFFKWIILLSLAALALLFFFLAQVDHQAYQSRIERIRMLQLEAANLIQQTLLVESGKSMHFDYIKLSEQGIEKLKNEISTSDNHVNVLIVAINEVLETTTQIKSTFAVLHNSWLYLPTGVALLRAELFNAGLQAIIVKIEKIECTVMQFNVPYTQQKQDMLITYIDTLGEDANLLPRKINIQIHQLLQHAQILMDYAQRLHTLNTQLLTNKVDRTAQNLINSYRISYQLDMRQAGNAKVGLYLSIIALTFMILYLGRADLTKKD